MARNAYRDCSDLCDLRERESPVTAALLPAHTVHAGADPWRSRIFHGTPRGAWRGFGKWNSAGIPIGGGGSRAIAPDSWCGAARWLSTCGEAPGGSTWGQVLNAYFFHALAPDYRLDDGAGA